MTQRVAATETTRERLRALIDGRLGTGAERSDLVRLAARLILEEALEAEVRDALGRERYERGAGAPAGYRNGYRTGRMRTAEGMVMSSAPQVRATAEPFASAIRANLAGRTETLEDLAIELFARGLSTRDIEDAFTDDAGRRLVSRAAVSERSRSGCGRSTRPSRAATWPSSGSPTCSSTGSPSGCGPASRASRSWRRGAWAGPGRRSYST